MSATYVLGDNLYINLTNKCTCNCEFCIRHTTDHVAESDSLWYKGDEPAKEDILAEIPLLAGEEIPRLTYWQVLVRLLLLPFC